MDHIPDLERALHDLIGSIHADYVKAIEKEHKRFRVGFEGNFGGHAHNPRTLSATFLGTLVSVEGIVTRCTAWRRPCRRQVYAAAHASFRMSPAGRTVRDRLAGAAQGRPIGALLRGDGHVYTALLPRRHQLWRIWPHHVGVPHRGT